MKPTKDQLIALLMQPGATTPDDAMRPFRPFRLVFRTAEGVQRFEFRERGWVGYLWEVGRFHIVRPQGGRDTRDYDDLLEAGFVDELDSRGETRAAS